MAFHERRATLSKGTVTNQVYTFNNTVGVDLMASGDTTNILVTRVADGATAADGGVVTYAADLTTALTQALNGTTLFAGDTTATDVSVVKDSTTEVYTVTVAGNYAGGNYDFATSGATGFTEGFADATGIVEVTEGSVAYSGSIPIGRFAAIQRVMLNDLNDASVDVTIKDQGGSTGYQTVYTKTALDVSSKVDKFLGYDAARSSAAGTTSDYGQHVIAEGPLAVSVTGSGPDATDTVPVVRVLVDDANGRGNILQRSTGTMVAASSATSGTVHLPNKFSKIRRFKLKTGTDNSVDFTVTDAEGKTIIAATGLDASSGYDFPLGGDGVDQADNALTGLCDVVAVSPLTCTTANHTNGDTAKFTFWCEV